MSKRHGSQRSETSISNVFFASSVLLAPFCLSLESLPFRLPEFAPPQIIYAKDLVPLLLAPWTPPSTVSRMLSRLLQSVLLYSLPKNAMLPCYSLWIAIALTRTLFGFVLSRSVGWTYPYLFSHWAFYESCGGYGPPLVAYLLGAGVRPNIPLLPACLRGHRWEATPSFVLLFLYTLLAGLDRTPWTYGVAIALALLGTAVRAVLLSARPAPPEPCHNHPDPHTRPNVRARADAHAALLLLALVVLPTLLSALAEHTTTTTTTTTTPPSPEATDAPLLDILLLSYPRPNDDDHAHTHTLLARTIASFVPYLSPGAVTLAVFTHAPPAHHPAFAHAQEAFRDTPGVTFHADRDAHPDARPGQHLHLAEAFRWWLAETRLRNLGAAAATAAEWVMLVEDDFPLCGAWGWRGVLGAMRALERGHRTPSRETTKMWGGFVGTGGSGLILHRTLLPVLAQTLRMHALAVSPLPPSVAPRPPDVIIQDCLLGYDPLCPTALSSRDAVEGVWFTDRQPTMVITSRLVLDHIGGHASTVEGRAYGSNQWRCGWRHPFHGRPQVDVVPV